MKRQPPQLHLLPIPARTSSTSVPGMLVLGLGNPGPGYRNTRHNVGFEAVDRICDQRGLSWRRPLFRNVMAAGDATLTLAKPLTYMNRSGEVIPYLVRRFAIPTGMICLVLDNMDLPVGEIRMKTRGGDAGHNGLKSVTAALGSSDYARIYIGVGRPAQGTSTVDHVLGTFSPEEDDAVTAAIRRLAEVFRSATLPPLPTLVSEVNRRRR